MKKLFTISISFLLLVSSFSALAAEVNFATFNIRMYGSSSKSVSADDRDKALVNFFKSELSNIDVFIFEEIMNPDRFKNNVASKLSLTCATYEHSDKGHMHVMLCHTSEFQFDMEPDFTDYAIQEVSLGLTGYRPALVGVLYDKDSNPLTHVVGLHLKAQEWHSDTRVKQIEILSEQLEKLDQSIPVVITGDWNTFNDDEKLIGDAFSLSSMGLSQIENIYDHTFRTKKYQSRFDHFWASPSITKTKDLEVYDICNDTSNDKKFKDRLETYNSTISDHCPVYVGLDL